MSQDSINKIREAEGKAKDMIEDARQEVEQGIISEKNKWEDAMQIVVDEADNKLSESVKNAKEESERIKDNRRSEIEEKVNNVKNNSENKIDESVDFVIEKFISKYR